MDLLKDKIIHHRFILLLLLLYFFLHLLNLTTLPIFNDEAIYLDWGWAQTHVQGHLYDSLADAKQPFLMWVFSFFVSIFTDPLFAGRFVSVLIGGVTLVGIYTLAKKLLTKNAALLAAGLYTIIPIIVFYNRQALMESAIACIGIWSCNALLNLLRKPTTKNGILLGCILGIGFFIKSSALLFIMGSAIVVVVFLYKHKSMELIRAYGISILSAISVNILLLINPLFWQTLSTNSRYTVTAGEFFSFPFVLWIHNILGFFEIGFFFITPFIFICSLFGIGLLLRAKNEQKNIFIVYFLIAFILELFSTKSQSQRYLLPFIPFLVIPASLILSKLWRGNLLQKLVVFVSFMVPCVLSFVLICNPEQYIMQFSKVSHYSDTGYIQGQTAGYGITEAMRYIKQHSAPNQPSLVFFALNVGNPENAVSIYSQKDPRLVPLHIDAKLFSHLDQYNCLTSHYPSFIVTRNEQQMGLNHYLSFEKSFPNPDPNYSVKIYRFNKNCTGETYVISDVYEDLIKNALEMK